MGVWVGSNRDHFQMVMVKITILAMTIIPFLSSNGHGQIVRINRYFNSVNKFQQFQQQKVWNCRDGLDRIWIDH
jgi:hypothetical protein